MDLSNRVRTYYSRNPERRYAETTTDMDFIEMMLDSKTHHTPADAQVLNAMLARALDEHLRAGKQLARRNR